jgi:hypothetical protein
MSTASLENYQNMTGSELPETRIGSEFLTRNSGSKSKIASPDSENTDHKDQTPN